MRPSVLSALSPTPRAALAAIFIAALGAGLLEHRLDVFVALAAGLIGVAVILANERSEAHSWIAVVVSATAVVAFAAVPAVGIAPAAALSLGVILWGVGLALARTRPLEPTRLAPALGGAGWALQLLVVLFALSSLT
ncbi:MAG: hypothetical protein ACOZNI_09800 [Myxococcota bacterium]